MLVVILAEIAVDVNYKTAEISSSIIFINTSFGGLAFLLIRENSLVCGGLCEALVRRCEALI